MPKPKRQKNFNPRIPIKEPDSDFEISVMGFLWPLNIGI
jgi:hypothetical protein